MPWVNPATRATDYKVTSANWNELVNNSLFLAEVNYTEFTSDVTINTTVVGSAIQIVTSGAITYEAVPHLIEFSCPRLTATANVCNLILRDGSTVLGTLAQFASSTAETGIHIVNRRTPSAASHSFNVAAWMGGATNSVFKAGTGGAAGDATTFVPGFIRITRCPT